MKVLIIGGSGMLGHKLVEVLGNHFNVYATIKSTIAEYKEMDFFDKSKIFEKIDVNNFSEINNVIEAVQPSVVINAVGIIKQKSESKDIIKTLEINSIFPQRLGQLAAEKNFKFITFSTDCVFQGTKGLYEDSDIPDALDLYGRSKVFGEAVGKNCLTIRTSIIGRELQTNHSLVEWFISNRGGKVRGFKNAIYSGFPTIILAGIIVKIIKDYPKLEGLWHISSDPISKFELLKLVNKAYSLNIEIEPFEDFKIDRSLNSSKFRNLTNFKPESWEKMVRQMAEDQMPYQKWRDTLNN